MIRRLASLNLSSAVWPGQNGLSETTSIKAPCSRASVGVCSCVALLGLIERL
jgi:hypothetical protein